MNNQISFYLAAILLMAAAWPGNSQPYFPPLPDAPQRETRPAPRESAFSVDVLSRGDAVEKYLLHGRLYIEALENAEYEIRVHNPSGVRVAVALSVDGLNTIDAQRTSAANASKWVIEPYGTITIKGWQVSGNRARHFYFTNERESYAAKLGQTANFGVISAVFFRELRPAVVITPAPRRPRQDDESRAADASAPSASRSIAGKGKNKADGDYAATGIGQDVRHDVTWTQMELETQPAASVALRYEFRDALVRLGLKPRPRPDADPPLRRRERSTGFEEPRYSPEP